MKWFDLLSIMGSVQGVLLAILLFSRPKNCFANRFLAGFVLLLTLSLTEYLYQPHLPKWANAGIGGLVFLYGPLLLLYTKALLGDVLEPFFLIRHVAVLAVYWALLGCSYSVGWETNECLDVTIANGFFGQVFWYSIKAWQRVGQEYKREPVLVHLSKLRWLQTMIGLWSAVYGLAFMAMYLLVFNVPSVDGLLGMIQTGCVGVVYTLSYWTLVQPDLEVSQPQMAQEAVKYQHSTLTQADKQQHLHRIITYLTEQKPYLELELTLDQLAKTLAINRFYISQVINEQLGKNFSELINDYRVAEAKRLLLDPTKAHYSMVGVGFEAGFKSKTAFNTTFKKMTGLSPTVYRKSTQQGVPIEQTEQ